MASPWSQFSSRIERARRRGIEIVLAPGLSAEEIEECSQRWPIPEAIRELMVHAAGFSVEGFGQVDWRGTLPFELPELFPAGVALAVDGAGNCWIADVSRSLKPMFVLCHDPPVVAIQAADIDAFLDQVFDLTDLPRVIEASVADIWRRNPHAVSRKQAMASTDARVRSFAAKLGEDFLITDLRGQKIGSGFIWGLAGPNTELSRDGEELLFAARGKKPGMLERLRSLWS